MYVERKGELNANFHTPRLFPDKSGMLLLYCLYESVLKILTIRAVYDSISAYMYGNVLKTGNLE